jgi:hypothetical protein
MLVHVDQLGRLSNTPQDRLQDGLRLPHKSDHGAVVIGVHLLIEQTDRPIMRNFGSNGLNYRFISAFAEVGNALYELIHALSSGFDGAIANQVTLCKLLNNNVLERLLQKQLQ